MNTAQSSLKTRLKVGIFTILGLLLIFATTVVVNDRPYWWRGCQFVRINVEDATGLKTKSPIRSLGIEIGYLKTVELSETHVTLGICITAPVEVLPNTRAYIRGEGFLGDKFVELKPVKYLGQAPTGEKPISIESKRKSLAWLDFFLIPSAYAQSSEKMGKKSGREIPVGEEAQDVQHLVNRVDDLVHQVSGLADNLKQAINPEDLKRTMKQLNQTLENASKTLAPEGGLNQTAQRTLAKLEDSIEQLRDLMTRVNKGQGSVGMLLNDPSYAEEIRLAIRNINKLLNKVQDVRFVVDLGGAQLTGYDGGRGWFNLAIWPNKDRYYLLGISSDTRGRISNMTTVTTAGGHTQTIQTQTIDQTGILLTGMLGKVFFDRIDLSAGALYGDGAASIALRLGPTGSEDRFQIRNDVYFRNSAASVQDRVTVSAILFSGLYLKAGVESFSPVNGKTPFFIGGGITFDDEDIKLLFAFK